MILSLYSRRPAAGQDATAAGRGWRRRLRLIQALLLAGLAGDVLAGDTQLDADSTGVRPTRASVPASVPASGPASAPASVMESRPPIALAVSSTVHEDLAALSARGRLTLPALFARPLLRHDLARRLSMMGAPGRTPRGTPGPAPGGARGGATDAAGERARRAVAAELLELQASSARNPTALIELADDDARLRVSGFARFQAEASPGRGFVTTDSTRFGLRFDLTLRPGLYLFQELYVADIERGQEFADPLIPDSDVIIFQDRAYIALATRYAAITVGRDRLAWGPGANGTLLMSETARPFTHLRLSRTFLGGRFHATIVNGVLSAAEDRYIALHRLDWRPHPRLRLGLAEGARYGGDQLEPLYLVGIIPYTLVGRLLERDHDDRASDELVRNNIMWDLDFGWRVRPGTEAYGEVLLDDLGTATSQTPTRLGYQLGLFHVGDLRQREFRLRLEWTRVWRYVYSVFYGADYAHEGEPLGYPLGADSRHVSAQVDWLVDDVWTIGARVVRQDRGENRLGQFWDPADPAASGADASHFEGVVERQWQVLGALAFQPSSRFESRLELGFVRATNAAHVPGIETNGLIGRVVLALER